MNIFIPKELHVGYQNRSDTYTGKLAYVIYTDDKGKLRKETSWQSWRDKKIEPTVFENEPTSGFVLNKKVGDYRGSWDGRRAWCRVYDPRGFEFEITIENLLYILENASSIKGKGLEGEFVYGWDRDNLLLIPVDAPDYPEFLAYRDTLYDKTTIKAKELILGATYKTNQNCKVVYMGRFDAWTEYRWWYRRDGEDPQKNRGKHYFFVEVDSNGKMLTLHTIKSLSKRIICCLDEQPVPFYAELMDQLEGKEEYSPVDKTKEKLIAYSLKAFLKKHEQYSYNNNFFGDDGTMYQLQKDYRVNEFRVWDPKTERNPGTFRWNVTYGHDKRYDSLEEVFNEYHPHYKNTYLANGKFYRREL